jgi:hypothetical protein
MLFNVFKNLKGYKLFKNYDSLQNVIKEMHEDDKKKINLIWNKINKNDSKKILDIAKIFSLKYKQNIVRQTNVNTLEELLEQANKCYSTAIFNLQKLVKKHNGEFLSTPIKNVNRIKQKVENDYNGEYNRCLDLVRVSALFKSSLHFINFLIYLNRTKIYNIIRVKDRFNNPIENGYMDILINIRIKNHICELQVHLTDLYYYKELGHRILEIERVLPFNHKCEDGSHRNSISINQTEDITNRNSICIYPEIESKQNSIYIYPEIESKRNSICINENEEDISNNNNLINIQPNPIEDNSNNLINIQSNKINNINLIAVKSRICNIL